MQSVPITTKIVSWKPVYGEVYSIQHYVIQFIIDLWQVGGFLWVLSFPPPIKLTARYNWSICESDIKHHKPNQINQIEVHIDNSLCLVTTDRKAKVILFEMAHMCQSYNLFYSNVLLVSINWFDKQNVISLYYCSLYSWLLL